MKKQFELGLLKFGLFSLLGCSLAGLFSQFYWFLDLFNHFRPQAAVFGLMFAAIYIFYRSWTYVFLAVFVFVLNVSLMSYRLLQFDSDSVGSMEKSSSSNQVALLSSNVLASNSGIRNVVAMVKEKNPDIFIVTEVNQKWVTGLQEITTEYPHYMTFPREDNFGMAVYSRIPFEGKFELSGDYDLPIGVFDFGLFSVLSVHPPPPVSSAYSAEFNKYISSAIQLADVQNKPIVMAGDFNTTVWSDNAVPFVASGFVSANPYGLAWTYPRGDFLFAIQIDHILGRGVSFSEFESLEDVGSDHYPVYSEFSVPQ